MKIIYRVCDKVNTFSGPPREFGLSKSELIKTCFSSIIQSCEANYLNKGSYHFDIVSDHCTEDTLQFIKSMLTFYGYSYKLHELKETGNGASLQACYDIGLNYKENDILYFVEDDYLHDEAAMRSIDNFYTCLQAYNLGRLDVAVHPCDYIDRYVQGEVLPSYIILSKDRHWRSIKKTTGTFLISGKILRKHIQKYIDFTAIGKKPGVTEDNTINLVYDNILCFSPLPTLAIHLQYQNTLSPFTSWAGLANKAQNFYKATLEGSI